MPLPQKIFVNYRRDDRPELIKKIRDGFVVRYGEDNVFMDLDIPNFSRFIDYLEEKVKEADVLLAFIGPKWLELLIDRADSDEEDILVKEIEQALRQQHTMVATICIDGASRPSKADLPVGIRDMLEFQIPRLRFRDDFLNDVRQVTVDMEREYNRRGVDRVNAQDLDSIVRLPPSVIETHVFELLVEDNMLRVEKLLRELPIYVLDKFTELEESQDELLKAMVNGIIVIGIVITNFGDIELFKDFLRLIHTILNGTYRRFSPEVHPSSKSRWIGYEFLRKLYLLGAVLVCEGNYDRIPLLLDFRVAWDSSYRKSSSHTFFLFGGHFDMILDEKLLLVSIVKEITSSESDAYFFKQFLNDEDSFISSICQFDIIHCLYDTLCNHDGERHSAFPFFGAYYFDRAAPAMELMIEDTRLRLKVLCNQATNVALAEALVRYCTYARNNHSKWNDRWDNPPPQSVKQFVEQNLSKELKDTPNFYL